MRNSTTGKVIVVPIGFKRERVNFPAITGEENEKDVTIDFPKTVLAAESFINGFKVGFVNTDKPLREIHVNTHATFEGDDDNVKVTVRLGLRDNSGTFDDPYKGFVDVVVVAELAPGEDDPES